MKIVIEFEDQLTGMDTTAQISMHEAQRLYKALREIVGDVQYEAKPGELITMPDLSIKV